MQLFLKLFGILMLVFVLSCSVTKKKGALIEKSVPVSSTKANIVLGLQKTACYGSCPVYHVEYTNQGFAYYKGINNVEKLGDWEAALSVEDFEGLFEHANRINFIDLADSFPKNNHLMIMDAPNTITYLKEGDTAKRVIHNHAGPRELIAFERALVEMTDSLNWQQPKLKEGNNQ